MKSKIIIFGNGYFATRIHDSFNSTISKDSIKCFKDIQQVINFHKPDIIINAIGYTGARNVDDCELELDKTLSSNTYVPLMMGEVALRNKIKLIHLSSGCIFHFNYKKQKPIDEKLIPDYYDLYYSRTKVYTENVFRELMKHANILMLRVRIPLDDRPHPKNLLDKLIKYKKIINIPNSLTYIPDFLKALQHLIKIDARGTFNIACKGGLRYQDLMDAYQKLCPEYSYELISLKQLNLVRTNLLLSTKKLEKTGFKVRTPKEVINECVRHYVQSS